MSIKPKRIPYGVADYGSMKRNHMYYVDKTAYIPLIEESPYYLLFIRPRRFGKSLWLSTLAHYYDINQAEHFTELFGDTYIGQHPTEERNAYLVLRLDFSQINPAPDLVQSSFETYTARVFKGFLRSYERFFSPEERQDILSTTGADVRLQALLEYAAEHALKVYVLIDEYDNFANTILSTVGQQAYQDLTHGAGFFRYFFNLLKGAAGEGRLTRLFITGVSPVTMDDVTSGFNIGTNISLQREFNALLGFREEEVRHILSYYRQVGWLSLDEEACLATMSAWYNGYRFAVDAPESVYNSDMVFHFLLQAQHREHIPHNLIDTNIRVDYGKLRHLMLVNQQLNGNFSVLQHLAEEGQTLGHVVPSFPLEDLLNRQNFISLLFYFGLLSFYGLSQGMPVLRIPNLTVKTLLYGYLRDALRDVNAFRVDIYTFSNLMRRMAYLGEWQPVFDFLAAEVRQQTSVRDYLAAEKVIQGFLLAYLSITNYYLTWSERELGGGFADIYLEPFVLHYPDMKYGYLIELKYLPRGKYSPQRQAALVAEAEAQLQTYLHDARLDKLRGSVEIKSLVLVYNGWELVYREEVQGI